MSDLSLTNEKSKVYIDILHYIRIYITENQLSYGDKIPSERELAEKLNVGRSSVREALRALELLGMIETRRGEGTFLKDFRDHNLIDLLGTFILEDSKAIDDVIEMNNMLEYNAIQLLLRSNHESELIALEKRLVHEGLTRYEFMKELVQLANNHLLYRIWIVLNEYVSLVHKYVNVEVDTVDKMKELVASLLARKQTEVLTSYQKLSLK